MATYPDSNLPEYEQDDDYGGREAAEFGGLAWLWINSALMAIERYLVEAVFVPRHQIVIVSRTFAVAGDVAIFDCDDAVVGGHAPTRTYLSGASVVARVAGVYVTPCSAGEHARVATAGVLPPNITGLPTAPGVAGEVGINAANGRLRLAQPGDVVVGYHDKNGNAFITGFGSLAV